MARIKKAFKKAQAGADTSKKAYTASFKRVIGDSVDMKKKIDSLGVSTSKTKDLLKARMAAKKQRDGGKTPAWTRKEGKNPEGGLNAKGVASYRAANPGSKLKTAVTTKPSKLKKGSKAASRRKSFCSRMSGMKKKLTSAKTANDPNSRINKSLRKWNC
jgi:hypothetical protein